MKALWETLKEFSEATRYALWQQQVAVPDYWNGAFAAAIRCALLALVLFAGVLVIRLCMLLFEKKRSPRRILTFAATLGVVVGLGLWAFRPQPLAAAGGVESLSLTRVTQGEEIVVPLTFHEQKMLTALLESGQYRFGLAASLPEETGGPCYRIAYQTPDGEAFLWVSAGAAIRYTSEDAGLFCPVLSGSVFYDALSAL